MCTCRMIMFMQMCMCVYEVHAGLMGSASDVYINVDSALCERGRRETVTGFTPSIGCCVYV